jgi:hypothetical protein
MSTEWLAIQSFQRDQNLLSAINTLSIHTKLELAGVADEERAEAAAKARGELASFLETLTRVADQIEQENALVGIDPRLRKLARRFVAARRNRRRFRSSLFTESLSDVMRLLTPEDEEEQQALVESLSDLRSLIEEHVYTDANQIFETF